MTARTDRFTGTVPPGWEIPRVLGGLDDRSTPIGLDEHLDRWGPLPSRTGPALTDELEASGLVGHGGAWFPVAAKWRSVRGGSLHRPIVVANAAEGEPASSKDELLLSSVPHLVLDGTAAAAMALGAHRAIVYAPRRLVVGTERAIASRNDRGMDGVVIEVVESPDRFLAGQESAVVRAIDRGVALPRFTAIDPVRRHGVERRPTLVHNVETLANIALVARYGAGWFRDAGTSDAPGTMLLTASGRWADRVIIEAPLGTTLGDVLALPREHAGTYSGVLLGGYGGGWLPPEAALELRLTEGNARQRGTSLGAGIVVLIGATQCPVAETARILYYLESQGAGQCGPCVHGLVELAQHCDQLATAGQPPAGIMEVLLDTCALVEGRGACRHPDGAARLVKSMITAFPGHIDQHLRWGPCSGISVATTLPGLEGIALGHGDRALRRRAGSGVRRGDR